MRASPASCTLLLPMVEISVIVPVAGDDRLARCLGALAEQSIDPSTYEVLVADNAPSERTRQIVSAAVAARYLPAPGPGAYAARNAGVRAARGGILAFTDADCIPPSGWLAAIGVILADTSIDVAVAPSYALNTDPIGLLVQALDDQRWARVAAEGPISYCDTRNLAARRELLVREPFDETFRHGGDLEWGVRLSRRGVRIVVAPEMALGHTNVSTLRAAWRRGVRRGRGLARLAQKHGEGARISGERPLRLLGFDVKTRLLRTLARPWARPVARVALAAATGVAAAMVATCLAVPVLRPRARAAFHLFDRASLLLGRIIGP